MSEAVELEPCPLCASLPCDWVEDPHHNFNLAIWALAHIREIAGVGVTPMLSELPDAVRAAWNRRHLTGEGEPVGRADRPALDIPALQREVAEIIVRDVLQEEYDDLVEGYLDEIMRASLRIIRLPGYSVVARAFETNLADALISASGGGE